MDDYLVKDMTAEAVEAFKKTRFFGWLQARNARFRERHYDQTERRYKGTATSE